MTQLLLEAHRAVQQRCQRWRGSVALDQRCYYMPCLVSIGMAAS